MRCYLLRSHDALKRGCDPSKRSSAPLIAAAAFLIVCCIRKSSPSLRATPALSTAILHKEELLPVYDLPAAFPGEPPHLMPMDPSALVPRGVHPIDVAHRKGYLHEGHILFVIDASGSLLFLQRSADVVTCPGTWSLLGEHANAGEDPGETAVRGLEEELGFVALDSDKSDFRDASWSVELRPGGDASGSARVTMRNATELPLYYVRRYGPRNDDRIDRQLTYLWIAEFSKKHEEIRWQLDDEVANHKWISLDEARSWLSDDATKYGEVFEIEGGAEDDGPDEGDFCHGTIRSLYEAGLTGMI